MTLPDTSLCLLTDFYQLTMAYCYWKAGLDKRDAVFHLFFRKPPFHGGFTITAGLQNAIEYLNRFKFDKSDIDYLANLRDSENKPYFCEDFFKYLLDMKFTCSIDAIPEGNVVFPHEPLLRITGPLLQCQLLESPLLNLINFPSLIATKAARICIAAQGDPVFEFGLRRAQGINGALAASRASYIGGCEGTSNVLAGKLYGIPVLGTHSHSWVMAFENEQEAFDVYAKELPNHTVLLVDTYNSLEGVKHAITTGQELKKRGKKLQGIRLDSGDLAYLSIKSREMLDAAGFHDTKIVASNELDETIIAELKRQGARIDVWGVGTHLVTAVNQPALDGVYKLSAIKDAEGQWQYKLKLSEQMLKISNPGISQIRRFRLHDEYVADAIYDVKLGIKSPCTIVDPLDPTRKKQMPKECQEQDMLVPIFHNGECVYKSPPLKEIRATTQKELSGFHAGIKRFIHPHQYIVGMEKSLYDVKVKLIDDVRSHSSYSYIPEG